MQPTRRAPWSFNTWGDQEVRELAAEAAGDVPASLRLARRLEPAARDTGRRTWRAFSTLATLGAVDLTTARVAEPHLDAVAILDQAGRPTPYGATWGVYAAAPSGTTLAAAETDDGAWRLSGVKQWCSLADHVSHALVTAALPDGLSGLFEVGLRTSGALSDGVRIDASAWAPRGLVDVATSTITLSEVPASRVGAPGWYLDRPGFAWGGIGVAAVWFGGAAAVAGALWDAARARHPDQIAQMHLGFADATLHAALLALEHAAQRIDAGRADGDAGRVLAARVRAQVARCAEDVLTTVGHALGPGPLALDPVHAARVADLTLYVRQHHAERDLAALGALSVSAADSTGDDVP